MQISEKGLNLIKKFEGFSSKPYLCPANVPTIGFGSTYYENGMLVTLDDDSISEQRATEILKFTTDKMYGSFVNKAVKVKLNQNQFDALVSFAYNLGNGNLQQSTLLKKVNSNDFIGASLEFEKWNKAGGKVLSGLTKRRTAEKELFLS